MEEPKYSQRVLIWMLGAAAAVALVGLFLRRGDMPPEEDSTCEVTGIVAAPNGTPVASFELAVLSPDMKTTIRRETVSRRESGSFAFSVPKGEYAIVCRAHGYAAHEAPFTAAPPRVHLRIELRK
ncbi:MAG TPA: hypothetical protein DCM87_03195 [Planctomycetes bacterium]|nr:hypothetical protein [Planctomycetota bacterium]